MDGAALIFKTKFWNRSAYEIHFPCIADADRLSIGCNHRRSLLDSASGSLDRDIDFRIGKNNPQTYEKSACRRNPAGGHCSCCLYGTAADSDKDLPQAASGLRADCRKHLYLLSAGGTQSSERKHESLQSR